MQDFIFLCKLVRTRYAQYEQIIEKIRLKNKEIRFFKQKNILERIWIILMRYLIKINHV